MVRGLFDTNILIDYLNAVPEASAELDRYENNAISIVTWMEVMVGADPVVENETRSFLEGFDVIALDSRIAEQAVALRQSYRMKLPDAVVWASARVNHMLFVTRNTKDFPAKDPSIRAPYVV